MEAQRERLQIYAQAARDVAQGRRRGAAYCAAVRSFSVSLMTCGLPATLALYKTRGRSADGLVYRQVSDWVCSRLAVEAALNINEVAKENGAEKDDGNDDRQPSAVRRLDLLRLILQNDSLFLRRAMREAHAYCTWLARLTRSDKGTPTGDEIVVESAGGK